MNVDFSCVGLLVFSITVAACTVIAAAGIGLGIAVGKWAYGLIL